MITSTSNPKIKWVRSLQNQQHTRQEEKVFIVEGIRLCDEARQAGLSVQIVLYTPNLDQRGLTILDEFTHRGAQIEQVTERVMRAASDTQSPQGILAVIPQNQIHQPGELDFVIICDRVRDPGNLGTILRSALAAGVQAVWMPPGSVDIYSPKVVRAGMGAHFHLPIVDLTWEEIRDQLQSHNLNAYLADAGGKIIYSQINFREPAALILGGEAEGAGGQARSLATQTVKIPMPGGTDSLNVAIAAGVLLFEVVRQRTTDKLEK